MLQLKVHNDRESSVSIFCLVKHLLLLMNSINNLLSLALTYILATSIFSSLGLRSFQVIYPYIPSRTAYGLHEPPPNATSTTLPVSIFTNTHPLSIFLRKMHHKVQKPRLLFHILLPNYPCMAQLLFYVHFSVHRRIHHFEMASSILHRQ